MAEVNQALDALDTNSTSFAYDFIISNREFSSKLTMLKANMLSYLFSRTYLFKQTVNDVKMALTKTQITVVSRQPEVKQNKFK